MSNILMNFQDLNFLLYDVLDVEKLIVNLCFNDYSCEIFDVIIEMVYFIVRDWFVLCVVKLDEYEL